MATVSSDKQAELRARLERLGVREEDLEERFLRSRGPGGQNVNKSSTCVVLHHRRSGLRVRCQETRSQALNRFLARRRLAEALERRLRGEVARRSAEVEKARRQKRRRSRRARAKMLAEKAHQARKKERRRPVPPE